MYRVALLLIASLSAPAVFAAEPIVWRPDYQAARAESLERKLPLVVVIGSTNCPHCQRQDSTTFADPAVVAALNGRAVPLKIAGNASLAYVRALGVTTYPTTVIAAPDGTILQFLPGYTPPAEMASALAKHAPGPDLSATRRQADEAALSAAKLYLAFGDSQRAAGNESAAAEAFDRAIAVAPGTLPAAEAANRLTAGRARATGRTVSQPGR